MKLDWAYLRNGWVSCKNARDALAQNKVRIAVEEDARKQSYPGEAAWQMFAEAKKIYVASGKKIMEFDPATADRNLLLKKAIGPSGNLRAPTIRVGKIFYVGFHPEMYDRLVQTQCPWKKDILNQ